MMINIWAPINWSSSYGLIAHWKERSDFIVRTGLSPGGEGSIPSKSTKLIMNYVICPICDFELMSLKSDDSYWCYNCDSWEFYPSLNKECIWEDPLDVNTIKIEIMHNEKKLYFFKFDQNFKKWLLLISLDSTLFKKEYYKNLHKFIDKIFTMKCFW